MLIPLRNARCGQQRLSPRPQTAVAARHPAIIRAAASPCRYGFPSCALAQRTNLRGRLPHRRGFHLRAAHFQTNSPLSTLHPRAGSAQVGKPVYLCTSCEPGPCPVEGVGKPGQGRLKGAWVAPIRGRGVRNRLPARIFTVDFLRRRRTIRAVRFPNSAIASFTSRSRLGMKRDLRGESHE